MAITDWPESERPREKLIRNGGETLSDSELLAIFLRTGARGKSAVDLARDLIARYGGIRALLDADLESFCENHGMGPAKYVLFQAALEIGKRYLEEQVKEPEPITNSDKTKTYLATAMRNLEHEVFGCMFLDNLNGLIEFEIIFHGTINQSAVYPREIIKKALKHNAAAVILAHNHPSGSLEPSREDIELTKRVTEALALIDIRVLDHVIVAKGKTVSFADTGLIP